MYLVTIPKQEISVLHMKWVCVRANPDTNCVLKAEHKDRGHSCEHAVTSFILKWIKILKLKSFFFTSLPWLSNTPLICSPFQQSSMKKLSIFAVTNSSCTLSSARKALPQWPTNCSWQGHQWPLHCWVWQSVFIAFSLSSLILFTWFPGCHTLLV